jgi:hypothetical protein
MANQVEGVPDISAVEGVAYPSSVEGRDFAYWLYNNWTYDPITDIWTPNAGIGSDLILNNAFNSTANWVLDADWAIGGGVLTHTPGATGYAQRQALACGGKWVKVVYSIKRLAAPITFVTKIGSHISYVSNPAVADGYIMDLCAINGYFNFQASTATLDADFDDVYLYPYTQGDLTVLRNYGAQYGYSVAVSLGLPHVMAGAIVRYSDANNFVLATVEQLLNGSARVWLWTKIAGAYALKTSAEAGAYTEWDNLQIRFSDADNVQVWYGPAGSEALKIAATDISAVPAGTYAGGFGANSNVGLKNLSTL